MKIMKRIGMKMTQEEMTEIVVEMAMELEVMHEHMHQILMEMGIMEIEEPGPDGEMPDESGQGRAA